MNKKEYLKKLKRFLPASERAEILSDYEDHFATGLSEGKTEQDIASELGDPKDVASEYGYEVKSVPTKNIVFSAIGLLFFDLLLGIAFVASLFAIWISLWSVVLSLLVTGVALIIAMFLSIVVNPLPWYICLTAGISILALTAVFAIGMIYVTKYYFMLMKWYGELHVKVFQSN